MQSQRKNKVPTRWYRKCKVVTLSEGKQRKTNATDRKSGMLYLEMHHSCLVLLVRHHLICSVIHVYFTTNAW